MGLIKKKIEVMTSKCCDGGIYFAAGYYPCDENAKCKKCDKSCQVVRTTKEILVPDTQAKII